MTFAPSPRTTTGFLEHVSKDIVGNATTPSDFEGTLWYVLYQLPERNRDVFLKIERDCMSVRGVGLEYGVTGQRIFDLNKDTKERMLEMWGGLLRTGFMEHMQLTAKEAREYGEKSAKEHYYKLGYTDGYNDCNESKEQKHFATDEFNNISISDLSLSYRTHHYLFDANLLNVSQIVECGDNILDIRNLGKGSITELIDRLYEFGVDVKRYFPITMNKYGIKVGD